MTIVEILSQICSEKSDAFFYTPKIYREGKSVLFKRSFRTVSFDTVDSVQEKLEQISTELEKQKNGFGFFQYELGYLLEEKLNRFFSPPENMPLFQFKFYDDKNTIVRNSSAIDHSGADSFMNENEFKINDLQLQIDPDSFSTKIKSIKDYIKRGDTYQVNFTTKIKFRIEGSLESFILSLIQNQSAKYIAIFNKGEHLVISISPELFFKIEEDEIIAKPMKGTIARGINTLEDIENIRRLRNSEKELAENTMIVDLLRNDLGRVCKIESVKTSKQFEIEKYESVFQMVSTIKGKLIKNSFAEIINNLFPCGSVTGAPKLRTMEIIHELEYTTRGVYTGAIALAQRSNICVNVPIRTIVVDRKTGSAEMGVGSGIVWDSDAANEFKELQAKSVFLTNVQERFDLFETMLVENSEIFLFEKHLSRLKNAAEYFLFDFPEELIRDELKRILQTTSLNDRLKIKLLLKKWGEFKIEKEKVDSIPNIVKVLLSEKRINSSSRFQYFKTTNRQFYDTELKIARKNSFAEVLFLNEHGEVAEGSFTNIVVKVNDNYYTPPIASGILNGCFREYLLDSQTNLSEKILSPEDLFKCDELHVVNSVRKWLRVKTLEYSGGTKNFD